jgi:hypothetical protein
MTDGLMIRQAGCREILPALRNRFFPKRKKKNCKKNGGELV